MAKSDFPPLATLRQLVRLDAATGKLYWLPREGNPKGWNRRWAGREALAAKSGGYRHGMIAGVYVAAHRVVYALSRGEVPDTVDHINGDRGDNRPENLRNVPQQVNCQNQPRRSTNKSGVIGVSWDNDRKAWMAMITFKGKQRSLGRFKDFGSAVLARHHAERAYGFHANHGRPLQP